MAAMVRAKKLPSLKSLLAEKPQRFAGRQSPEQQRVFFLDWARRTGLKVERYDSPIIQYPVKHG
jgi:hypothetical protein